MMRRALTAAVVIACVIAGGAAAHAFWHAGGVGSAAADSDVLEAPTGVSAIASGASVSVGWVVSSGVPEPEGYFVERIDVDGPQPACGSSPTALQTGSSCVDTGIASGEYTYRVTAVFRTWTARSAPSAPVAIDTSILGSAASFSILGSAVTTTGFSRVEGDLGTTPEMAVVGFTADMVDGEIHSGDVVAADAQAAAVAAYDSLRLRSVGAELDGDLVGRVLYPDVYHAGAALGLTGELTLDGEGDPDAEFVFLLDAAISPAAGSAIVLINGAQASNVYWSVDGAVSTGELSKFSGTILARGAVTLGAGAQLVGRALSLGAVTMADNDVRFAELVVTP